MADRNRDRGYQSFSRQDSLNDRSRYSQDSDINRPYGTVGYGDWNYESGYNDLDRNRYDQNNRNTNYRNTNDNTGRYGYRNDVDWNSRDVYGGSYHPDYGYGRMDERNRKSWREGRSDIYGNDYSGVDWNRRDMGDYNNDYGRNNYGQGYGYGSQMGNRYGTSGGAGTGYEGRQSWNNSNWNDRDNMNYGNQRNDRDWWDRTRDEVSSWFGDDDAERRRNMDRRNASNSYRGKGPRNYHRSEERIREDVCDRLTDDDLLDASNINIEVHGDEAILTGTVESREQKRRAEDLVESISGIRNVENRIKVNRNDDMTSDLRIRDESERE